MGSITSKMPLFVWDHLDDRYDFAQLAQNWQVVAFHDHTPGRGVPIPAGALAPGSVSATTFDTSVLSYISQHGGFVTQVPPSGTYNASSGDLVFAGATGPATATVQLPTPTQNARVGVVADTLVTSINPVVITASGGAHIFGLGVNNATSIVLGDVGANVLLQSDGTNWWIYAGQRDTGWLPLNFHDADWTPIVAGQFQAAYRVQGDSVQWSGMVKLQGTVTPLAIGQVFSDPIIIPTAKVFLPMVWSHSGGAQAAFLTIDTSGNVLLQAPVTPVINDFISFEGIQYRLA